MKETVNRVMAKVRNSAVYLSLFVVDATTISLSNALPLIQCTAIAPAIAQIIKYTGFFLFISVVVIDRKKNKGKFISKIDGMNATSPVIYHLPHSS